LEIEIPWSPVPVTEHIYFPGFSWRRHRSFDVYIEELQRSFPSHKQSITKYKDTIVHLGEEWKGILTGNRRFTALDLPYSMRYFQVSYADFIKRHFSGDSRLQGVLLAGLPDPQVALTVMAGYLFTQVFDACVIEGGMVEVWRKLNKFLVSHQVKQIFINSWEKSKVKNSQGVWTVFPEEEQSKVILDTRGDFQKHASSCSNLSWLSIHLELDNEMKSVLPKTEVWYIYPDTNVVEQLQLLERGKLLDQNILTVWNPSDRSGQKEIKMTNLRIDVPFCAQGNSFDYDGVINRVLKQLENTVPSLSSRIKGYQFITPEQHGELSGFKAGTGSRWAFRVNQVIRNPLQMETSKNYYSTYQWGFAWFSSAAVVAKQIIDSTF
jgi:hypothetical protein